MPKHKSRFTSGAILVAASLVTSSLCAPQSPASLPKQERRLCTLAAGKVYDVLNPEFAVVVGEGLVETFYPWITGPPARDCDPDNRECKKAGPLQTGTPVQEMFSHGRWTCGYYDKANGAGAVWIPTARLKPLAINPKPSVKDWIGTWHSPPNYLVISKGRAKALTIAGKAYWYGRFSTHYGSFSAEAIPDRNPLQLKTGGCEVTLTLVGAYLRSMDNGACGGANVRFQGFWRKQPKHSS